MIFQKICSHIHVYLYVYAVRKVYKYKNNINEEKNCLKRNMTAPDGHRRIVPTYLDEYGTCLSAFVFTTSGYVNTHIYLSPGLAYAVRHGLVKYLLIEIRCTNKPTRRN